MDNDTTTTTTASNKGSIVAALTPLIAIVAGWLTAVAAKHIPGLQLDPTQITAVMIATITSVLGVAVKWLHGWQRHEARVATQPAIEEPHPAFAPPRAA